MQETYTLYYIRREMVAYGLKLLVYNTVGMLQKLSTVLNRMQPLTVHGTGSRDVQVTQC